MTEPIHKEVNPPADHQGAHHNDAPSIADAIDAIGYAENESLSINTKGADGIFRSSVLPLGRAIASASSQPDDTNVWWGVNPVRPDVTGRGTEADITRFADAVADIDIKPGACPDMQTAVAIVDDIAAGLGEYPSLVVESGHGLQAHWAIDGGEITEGFTTADAKNLSNRFGQYVSRVGETRGAKLDNISDTARIMRVPGSVNNKYPDNPVRVTISDRFKRGAPIAVEDLDERLADLGIVFADDGESDTIVSEPSRWQHAKQTCSYTRQMVKGWATDTPKARHPWLLTQTRRLACAARYGCLTEIDYKAAEKSLIARFNELTADRGLSDPHEITRALRNGREWAAKRTDEHVARELGGHEHIDPAFIIDPAATGELPAMIHSGQARYAYLLADEHKNRLMHVYGLGWQFFDGQRWQDDHVGKVNQATLALLREEKLDVTSQLAALDKESPARPGLVAELRALQRCESANGINGITALTASLPDIAATVKQLDADPYLLNVQNGTLNLETLEIRPHNAADRITKVCNASFDATAAAPQWQRFIEKVLPDPEVRGFVQRLIGSALIGEVLEHILPIFTGPGRNGKGTFYQVISHVLGDYAIAAEPELFMARDRAGTSGEVDLMGCRLAVVSESNRERSLDEAKMKRLVGGDTIRARRLYQNNIQFNPSHQAILITNHLPRVSGDDPATWARIRVVPFDVVIPADERDPRLLSKLKTEADGVLLWAVEGLRDYLARGLDEPDSVRVATDEYRRDMDSLSRFIDERCVTGATCQEFTSVLYREWVRWQQAEGCEPMGMLQFGKALDRRGHRARHTREGALRRRIRLKNDTEFTVERDDSRDECDESQPDASAVTTRAGQSKSEEVPQNPSHSSQAEFSQPDVTSSRHSHLCRKGTSSCEGDECDDCDGFSQKSYARATADDEIAIARVRENPSHSSHSSREGTYDFWELLDAANASDDPATYCGHCTKPMKTEAELQRQVCDPCRESFERYIASEGGAL